MILGASSSRPLNINSSKQLATAAGVMPMWAQLWHNARYQIMDPAVSAPASPRPVFEDGLGKRFHAVSPGGEPLEVLALRDELVAVPSFEFAARERVTTLADFFSTSYVRLRGLKRLDQGSSTLALVSDRVSGTRLSDILKTAERHLLPVQANAALCVARQLLPAVASLHEKLPGICHGAIAPERLVVTPSGRLLIADYALGSALEQLHFPQERYWSELQIAVPKTSDGRQFDQRTDVMQIGVVVLALMYGRPLGADESLDRLGALAEGTWGVTESGAAAPLPAAVRTWLCRLLQLDARNSFASASAAAADFEHVVSTTDYAMQLAALKALVADCALRTGGARQAPAPAAPARQTYVAIAGSTPALPAQPTSPAQPLARAVPAPRVATVPLWWRSRRMTAAAILLAVGSVGVVAGRSYLLTPAAAEVPGTLVADTNPPGVPVIVDGKPRGVTPLTLNLSPGSHKLELAADTGVRTIPLTITSGSTVSQFIELPKPAVETGQLHVRTEPPGARVTVDGMLFGPSPVTVDRLAPGVHTVQLTNDLGSVTHQVMVTAGATASLVVPMAAPQGAPVSGWLAVSAPVELQVYENDQLLGSSRSDRIMVSAGRHELTIVNDSVGYRASRTLSVSPGQVAPIKLEWPTGSLALNAQPWADVWVDGEHVGETPIANVAVPIGPHEVVFRHPELGERAVRTTVTLNGPARLSVNLAQR
jgi:hypothetical protein